MTMAPTVPMKSIGPIPSMSQIITSPIDQIASAKFASMAPITTSSIPELISSLVNAHINRILNRIVGNRVPLSILANQNTSLTQSEKADIIKEVSSVLASSSKPKSASMPCANYCASNRAKKERKKVFIVNA